MRVSREDASTSYRSLLGNLRDHARSYVAKQLLLPRQEIRDLVAANLRAVGWLAVAVGFVFLAFVAFVVFVVGLIALVLPLWLAALATLVLFVAVAVLFAIVGWRKLELHGPDRSIRSFKETISWVKTTLLGRSES